MKILKDDQYAVLVANSNQFTAIVSAMLESNSDITAEDINAELILQAMQAEADSTLADTEGLQASLNTANERIAELESQIEAMQAEEDSTPAEEPASIVSKSETTAEKEDIVAFAAKNSDDPFAVIAQAKKEGLL